MAALTPEPRVGRSGRYGRVRAARPGGRPPDGLAGRAITPRWQTITDPPPTIASQIGFSRLLTQSRKFCMWLVGRPSGTASGRPSAARTGSSRRWPGRAAADEELALLAEEQHAVLVRADRIGLPSRLGTLPSLSTRLAGVGAAAAHGDHLWRRRRRCTAPGSSGGSCSRRPPLYGSSAFEHLDGDRAAAVHVQGPLGDVEVVGAPVGHLAAGVLVPPAELVVAVGLAGPPCGTAPSRSARARSPSPALRGPALPGSGRSVGLPPMRHSIVLTLPMRPARTSSTARRNMPPYSVRCWLPVWTTLPVSLTTFSAPAPPRR